MARNTQPKGRQAGNAPTVLPVGNAPKAQPANPQPATPATPTPATPAYPTNPTNALPNGTNGNPLPVASAATLLAMVQALVVTAGKPLWWYMHSAPNAHKAGSAARWQYRVLVLHGAGTPLPNGHVPYASATLVGVTMGTNGQPVAAQCWAAHSKPGAGSTWALASTPATNPGSSTGGSTPATAPQCAYVGAGCAATVHATSPATNGQPGGPVLALPPAGTSKNGAYALTAVYCGATWARLA